MSPVVAERDYYIHYYEVDFRKKCLITSIMNYFQDIAMMQSEDRGVGIDYLKENKIAWVLYKWDIKIEKYPEYTQKVKVRTYAYSFLKFYAYRKFEIIDEDGETMVSADTVWLLINTETKRPVKINDDMYSAYGIDKDSLEAPKAEKMGGLNRVDSMKEFEIRYNDIDTNMHVNNVKYADWAIETVPPDIVLNHTLKRIKVTYKKETRYGEFIKAYTEINDKSGEILCIHKIVDREGKELTLLESLWVMD